LRECVLLSTDGHERRQSAGMAGRIAAFPAVGLVFNAVLAASLPGPYQSLAMN
jgi:hypothetical protein